MTASRLAEQTADILVISSVYEKVVAPTPAKVELASIDGCFYLVRPTVTVKGAKECL